LLVTDRNDTLLDAWWPPGHVLGWEHTFVHELHHFLSSVEAHRSVRPHGADFEDGYRAALICDAVAHSATTGRVAKVSPAADTVEGALT
jgi:predicted dehydrogenase